MADAKISALPSASTPLAGTEVVPLVQSGATKKVAISDLTAGRNVSMAQLTATATTQKLADNDTADLTVQIGPDTPTAGRSGRLGFINSSTQKNWYLTNSWNTTGAFCLVQTTAAGGLAMSGTDSHQWLGNGDYKIVDGNLILGAAGKGVTLVSPNGSVIKTLTIDNAGNLVLV